MKHEAVGAEPEGGAVSPRLEEALTDGSLQPQNGQLLLIGRRQLRSLNSWMHNSPRLMRGKNRCTLLMHPNDALERKLDDNTTVRVTSRTGTVDAVLDIDDAMMPGVVSLPHGWGHSREGVELELASKKPGVSLNDLTDETHVDLLTGNAGLSGVNVSVESLDGA